VLSLDPLDGPGLHEAAPATSPGDDVVWIAGAPQDVEGAAGTVRTSDERPGRVIFEVDAHRDTALVVLDGFFPGSRATVNAHDAEVLPVGRHRAVRVPRGHSTVTMVYRPPGLRPGLGLCGAGAILIAGLRWRERLRLDGAGAAGGRGAASVAAKRTA